LKEAEAKKMSSNASIQDIITNSVEEYRKQERMQIEAEQVEQVEEEESEDSSSSSSASSSLPSEEELSQEMLSSEVGDIAEIAKVLTEGVAYRNNEGVKQLNAT